MKSILVKLSIFLIIGIIGVFKLKVHPFIEDTRMNNIIVVYKEQQYDFEVPSYTPLKDVLANLEFDEDVNLDAINEMQILKDGDKIVIPQKTEEACISINHASDIELMKVSGIGPKMAERIIQYRDDNGYFQKIEELMEVKGVGEKTFEKMKAYICI